MGSDVRFHFYVVQKNYPTKILIYTSADKNVGFDSFRHVFLICFVHNFHFFQKSDFLLAAGAEKGIKNGEGNESLHGIDGDKKGSQGVGGGYYKFQAAKTKEQLTSALETLESEGKDDLPDKVIAFNLVFNFEVFF